ncbi:LOW QUALITY PROTEIN: uncharacterized protein [Amphiura filiformis]|uniref:LOW QUALITY PROTEIN: uncharacterized protein n=1 Tax=Amphiura filiformis TaxID=82378 RepID=UPI003B213C7B
MISTMDVSQVESESSKVHHQDKDGPVNSSLVELEAQMASLLSLHNVTSDVTFPTPDMSSTDYQSAEDMYTVPDSSYVSVIKFNGQPIPPPVLSLACRLEMQAYKEEAIKKERDIAARRRRKLLDTVQDIVDRFEVTKQESRESTPREVAPREESETPDFTQSINNVTLPGLSDTEKWHYNEAIKSIEDKEQEDRETCEKEATSILQEIDSMLEAKSDDNDATIEETNPPDSTHHLKSTKPSLTTPETNVIPPSISSSASSSEGSALNRTVIAAEDGVDNYTDTNRTNMERDFNPPFQSTAIGFSKHQESEEHSLDKEAFLFHNHLKMTDNLRESWAESESNLSYLGEYRGLPTPISFVNPDLGVTQEQSTTSPEETNDQFSDDKPSNNQISTTEDKEFSTLSSAHTLSGTHSTHVTLDTVGQSCTLPLSLFSSSSNSTLCEVHDPFASYTDGAAPFNGTGRKVAGLSEGHPLDKNSNTESGSEPQLVTSNNKEATNVSKSCYQDEETQCKSEGEGTSTDEFKSPPKRVRRNSYTLDHPSPALLDAQARNEAPYASDEGSPQVLVDKHPTVRRSLELGGTDQTLMGTAKSEVGRVDQKRDSGSSVPPGDQQKEEPVLTEDNLVRLQLEQFELMRKQLEQKQRERLEEMLFTQHQEQLALQKEMASLELRFNQQDASKIYSSVFGMEESSQDDDQRHEESPTEILVKAKPMKRGSDATNPSLRDSLENAFPPPVLIPNSHSSPAIHTHSSQLSTMNTSYSNVSETADNRSMPFYLERSHDRSIDLDYMDVERSALNAWMPASDVRRQKIYSPSMQAKFERVSAVVKGYLTRRLMQTQKVQSIIKTIRDTVYFVDDFQAETPIKQGRLTLQDVALAERLLSQLSAARNELYDTFQTMPVRDRMAIIAQSRILQQQELRKTYEKSPDDYSSSRNTPVETKPLSTATLKALERKNKAKKLEDIVMNATKQPARTTNQRPMKRPKSVGGNRILRPIQGNQSPPSPVGAPFSFPISTAKEAPKPKAVIHRHTGTNKTMKNKSKTSANTTSNATTATGKKPKSVRRSLYPTTTGTTRGPAKSNARSKATRNTVLNKK